MYGMTVRCATPVQGAHFPSPAQQTVSFPRSRAFVVALALTRESPLHEIARSIRNKVSSEPGNDRGRVMRGVTVFQFYKSFQIIPKKSDFVL